MSVISEEKTKFVDSPYMANICQLVLYEKNDMLRKAISFFLAKNYQVAQDYLLATYPEYSLSEDSNALLLMGHIQLKLHQLDSAIEYFRQSLKMTAKENFFINDSLSMIYFYKKDYDTAIRYLEDARNYSLQNYYFYFHLGLYHEALMKKKGKDRNIIDEKNQLLELEDLRGRIKEYYETALRIKSNSFNALLNIGSIYASEESSTVAENYFKKALQLNQNDWKIHLNLAFLNMKEKSYDIALEYFERAIEILGDKIDKKILSPYIFCLYKEKCWKKLEKYSKKVLKIDKRDKRAFIYLLEALKNRKDFRQCNDLLSKLKTKLKNVKKNRKKEFSEKTSKHYDIIKKKVVHYLNELEKIRKAMDENTKLKEIEARDFKEFARISKLDTDNISSFGFNEDEIKNLLQIYKKNQDSVEALYSLGLINFKVENYSKSQELFLKVHGLDPNYQRSNVCGCLGDISLLVNNNPKEALNYFNESCKKAKENELVEVKIGVCYELLGKNDEALEHYKKSYDLNNEFPASIFHIGAIYDKQNNEEALKWFEMAYEKEKENVEYLRKYGDVLVRSKDKEHIEKGISILEKGLEFFTGNVDIMCSLSIGYEKQGKLKEAIQLLELANNNPNFFNNKSKVFQLACYYEKAKNFTKAVEQFKRVLLLEKNNTEALLHIGFIYKSCKEYVKSFKCFNKIITNEPNNPHAYYGLGKLFQIMNNRDNEAIQNYNKCIEIDPNYSKAKIQLGVLFLKTKNYDKSLEILMKVYEVEKNNPLCLTCIGNIYIEKKQYNEALRFLLDSLKLDKKNIATNAALADTYYALSKMDEAIHKYTTAIKLGGNLPEIYLNLAHCYYIKEKYDQSINNYISALKLVKNTRHDYYYYLGNALVGGKRYKDAIKAYQAAVKLNKNRLLYYFVLGRACYLENQYKSGIKYLEELMDIEKKLKNAKKENFDDKDVLFLLFKCYSSLPSVDKVKCKNLVSELMKDDPKNIKYINCLASLYEKTNQTFEAVQQYKKILKIDPKNMEAKENLKRLEDRDI